MKMKDVSRQLGRIAAIASMTLLFACDKASAPPPPLQVDVQCPVDRAEHAVGKFGKAQITFVCIDKKLASSPELLRCDLDSRPMICEDAGSFAFSRGADGKVFVGVLPELPTDNEEDDEDYVGSRLLINFQAGPPRVQTFDAVETHWRFLLTNGEALLPQAFTFVKGTLCDRSATVLDTGRCNLEATTASLYWHIAIEIPHRRDRPITEDEYRDELEFWLPFLGKLVVDSKAG